MNVLPFSVPLSRRPPPRRAVFFAMALGISCSLTAQVGGPALSRYYISVRPGAAFDHAALQQQVNAVAVSSTGQPQGGVVADILLPALRLNAVAAELTPEQADSLRPLFEVREDVPFYADGGPPSGTSWPIDQFTLPAVPAVPHFLGNAPPVVYVVDSGISATHTDFGYPPSQQTLTFLPGLSYGVDQSLPTKPPLPEYPDVSDHGTRVTGCLGGVVTGLLGPAGGKAAVKSVLIYDSPVPAGHPLATFASKAINGMLGAASDHIARRAVPYLKNHASVLVVAHSTSPASGRFADMDVAIEAACKAGMHVVLSAGNTNVVATDVSPAGAAWGYQMPDLSLLRFLWGPPPGGGTFYRAADEFLVAGAYQDNGLAGLGLWPNSNYNLSATVDPVDGFAPGAAVPCAANLPPGSYAVGAGTSYAAALTAAVTTYVVALRPWATPAQVRSAVRSARTFANGWPKVELPQMLPEKLSYSDWAYHFYPNAGQAAQRDPNADPDADGVPNFMEYASGFDPRYDDGGLNPQIEMTLDGNGANVSVKLPRAAFLGSTPEVNWTLEGSSDLTSWTPVTLDGYGETFPKTEIGDGSLWKATAVLSPRPTDRFFRIRYAAAGPLL